MCPHSYRSILTTSRGLNDQQKELLSHCWLKGLRKCCTRHQAARQGCENTNPTLNTSAIQCSYFLLSTRRDVGMMWTRSMLAGPKFAWRRWVSPSQADLYHSYQSSWYAHCVHTTQAADSSNHKTASPVPEDGWSWPWLSGQRPTKELDDMSWVWTPTRSGGSREYVLLEAWLDNLPSSIPKASRRGQHRSDAQSGKFLVVFLYWCPPRRWKLSAQDQRSQSSKSPLSYSTFFNALYFIPKWSDVAHMYHELQLAPVLDTDSYCQAGESPNRSNHKQSCSAQHNVGPFVFRLFFCRTLDQILTDN